MPGGLSELSPWEPAIAPEPPRPNPLPGGPEGEREPTAYAEMSSTPLIITSTVSHIHSAFDARRAPATRLSNFAQTISGSTSGLSIRVEAKPEAEPEIVWAKFESVVDLWLCFVPCS